MITYYKDNKHNILAAGAQRYWHGTKEAYEAKKDEIPSNTMICITNDNDGSVDIAPLGSIFAYYGLTAPQGYLLCDGSEFDANIYPELFNLLGRNRTPDLRETVIVGVGRNTTSSITDHDVYTLGQFKDDQLQGHEHTVYQIGGTAATPRFINDIYDSKNNTLKSKTQGITTDGTNGTPRVSKTTHGKQMGLNYIIRATISVNISNTSSMSKYTTDEVIVSKWIDGKSVYRKIYENKTATFSVADLNIDKVISLKGMVENNAGAVHEIPYEDTTGGQYIKTIYYNKNDKNIYIHSTGNNIVNNLIIMEYTKR